MKSEVAYQDDIVKRVWPKPDGSAVESRCWYGRLRPTAASRWKWVKLSADRRASLRMWEGHKQKAEMRAAGAVVDDAARLSRPLVELIADYHAGLTAQRCSPRHVSISRHLFARVLVLTGWTRFGQITADGAADLLAKLERAGATASYRNKYIMRLKAFVRSLLPESWPDPLRRLRRVREKGAARTRGRRAATAVQLAALVSSPDAAGRRVAYILAAFNGLRRNEVAQLDWSDVGEVAGVPVLSVRRKMGADDGRDVIPVHPYALAAMGPRPAAGCGRVVGSVPDVRTLVRDWERVGVAYADEQGRRLDFHALRHTFASSLDRAGASRTAKKKLMRHLSGDVTDGYSHAEVRELADLIARVPSPEGSPQGVSYWCPAGGQQGVISGRFEGFQSPHLGIRPRLQRAGNDIAPQDTVQAAGNGVVSRSPDRRPKAGRGAG